MSNLHEPIVDREFSPREAEEVTGVSVTLQRDWRRRNLLPEQKSKGWARFSVSDIIEMIVMKSFSDSGFSVQSAREFSRNIVMPTMKVLYSNPDAIDFADVIASPELKDMVMIQAYKNLPGPHFAVTRNKETGKFKVSPCATYDQIFELLHDSNAVHCTVIDCERIAKRIIDKADLPIARFDSLEPHK
jgi:hypothetical protein